MCLLAMQRRVRLVSDTIQRCLQVLTTPLTPVRIRPVLMLA
ncbi:hypothetical protein [Enterobacter phage 04_vB_Eclo_IJM]|nr:hypothetical protein [Enterobacter phage 03_vB_Eclo_IJM]UZT50485.1 hypothetical protein [Enterobacter phage 04_vB_Eclo_IJM]